MSKYFDDGIEMMIVSRVDVRWRTPANVGFDSGRTSLPMFFRGKDMVAEKTNSTFRCTDRCAAIVALNSDTYIMTAHMNISIIHRHLPPLQLTILISYQNHVIGPSSSERPYGPQAQHVGLSAVSKRHA